MRILLSLLLTLLVPAQAFAQSDAPTNDPGNSPGSEWQQPPLLDAPPPTPAPLPEGQAAQAAPTPPPPGYQPQGTTAVPYQYSPYAPQPPKDPGPEVGLMITEAAFGTLTAAGTGVLMYYFLVKPIATAGGGQFGSVSSTDATVTTLIFLLSFSSVPVAVAQSEISLANGSRYYYSESWPAWLSGLGVEAGVVGLFYLMGGVNSPYPYAEITLLVGTGLVLPLAEMVVINLTKQPRWKTGGAVMGSLLRYDEGQGLRVGLPTPVPVPVPGLGGAQLGLGLTLAQGHF